MTTQLHRVRTLLSKIYGEEAGGDVFRDLEPILDPYRGTVPQPRRRGLDESDAILITCADQLQEPGKPTIPALAEFCRVHLDGLVSGIHILPFFPWSSDDGFSVVDYKAVAPLYGAWDDVRRLGGQFRLMLDAVINHASVESPWFRSFLRDETEFREYFIEVRGSPDLSGVVRPRALPLLTEFEGPRGPRKIWTTFGADQVDLNYHNPKVLLRVIEILLFYVSQGAAFIRLDAIAYLWKEPGTPCINLPQTHWIVQLLRAVLDEIAPHVMLITETNVPNTENLSYFGDGSNEAHLVYNFPLPPLVLHAFQTGNASTVSRWAASLKQPPGDATFLNFLASHDGIGLNPVRGILSEAEIAAMARRIDAAGGFISNKMNADGTETPYELNVNYFDALDASDAELPPGLQIERFVTAHAILLALAGVPAIYFHSLFGSRGWPAGVSATGKYRSINREKLLRPDLERQLADLDSMRAQVFHRLSHLLRVRSSQASFSPRTPQRVLESPEPVFAVLREQPDSRTTVLCVSSVSGRPERVNLDLTQTSLVSARSLYDLISNRPYAGGQRFFLELAPYQSVWLTT